MIRKLCPLIVIFLCCARIAAAAPASEASIREMLAVTEARKLVDGMYPQFDQMMKASMSQALHGQTMTPAQQKIADNMRARMMEIMKQELSWEVLEPIYLNIYQQSFSQEEIDGMLAFYKTPAGAALIKKMPLVVQNTMTAMQQRMGPMMQKIQASTRDAIAEMEAEAAKAKHE